MCCVSVVDCKPQLILDPIYDPMTCHSYLVTKLINMAEAQKSLGKATAAYNSAPCQGDGCVSSRPLPLM